MKENEALILLEKARPVFELAAKHAWSDLEKFLEPGQLPLFGDIRSVWYAGWNSDDINYFCQKVGYSSLQIRAVSVYLWNTLLKEYADKKARIDRRLIWAFWIPTIIAMCIVGSILVFVIGAQNPGGTGSNKGGKQVLAYISLVICSPILGVGWVVRWFVDKRMFKKEVNSVRNKWPQDLWPGNDTMEEIM